MRRAIYSTIIPFDHILSINAEDLLQYTPLGVEQCTVENQIKTIGWNVAGTKIYHRVGMDFSLCEIFGVRGGVLFVIYESREDE